MWTLRVCLPAIWVLCLTSTALAQPATVFVDDDFDSSTPGWNVTHFAQIQAGIDAVADPGTVRVAAGTYLEQLVITKSLQVLGDATLPVIDGGDQVDIVTISGAGTRLDRFTLRNTADASNGVGARIIASDVTIERSVFQDCETGVLFEAAAARGTVRFCVFETYRVGAHLIGPDGTVSNSDFDDAVWFPSGGRDSIRVEGVRASILDNRVRYASPNDVSANGIHLSAAHDSVVTGNFVDKDYTGILVQDTTNVLLRDNDVLADTGIALTSSTGTVESCRVTALVNVLSWRHASGQSGATIRNNVLTSISQVTGQALLIDGVSMTVQGNVMTSGGVLLFGEDAAHWNSHSFSGNTVGGKPVYYIANQPGPLTVPSDAGQVIVASSQDVTIDGIVTDRATRAVSVGFSQRTRVTSCHISGDRDALYTFASPETVFESNRIEGAQTGAWLESDGAVVRNNAFTDCTIAMRVRADDVSVEDNTCLDCGYGVWAYEEQISTNRPVITGNRVTSPGLTSGVGLRIQALNGAIVRDNLLQDNQSGIVILDSNMCLLESNLIVSNSSTGIFSGTSSQPAFQCTFRGNVILEHPFGVRMTQELRDIYDSNVILQNGVGIDRRPLGSLIAHRFRDNVLINVQNAYDDGLSTWSFGNPAHGNFWSDYGGVDGNGDGVGDTPYLVPGGSNQDAVPWMEPPGRLPFSASAYEVSASAPSGPIALSLVAGPSQAGRTYLIALSATDFAPGTPLPGGQAVLPITADALTTFGLANVNTPVFSGFLGTIDAQGNAAAQLNLPPLPPVFVGRTVFLAAALAAPWNRVTNTIPIRVTP